MIRQENVTNRDLELLCAALDHALKPEEKVEFDRRLTESSHLANLYRTQRHLKTAMGQIPRRKVPHNFTLTRAEARKAKRGNILQPIFGWASAVSALLVAVVFGSQLFFNNLAFAPAPADGPPMVMMEEHATLNETASIGIMEEKPIYLLNWNYGARGMGGMDAIGGKGGASIDGSGGVNVNIYVDPEAIYEADLLLESDDILEEMPREDFSVEMLPEEQIEDSLVDQWAFSVEEPPLDEVEAPATKQLHREPPKIYGIDPDKVGTIVKMNPDFSFGQLEEATENQAQPIEELSNKQPVQTEVSIALLSAALIFGLVWYYLKYRR